MSSIPGRLAAALALGALVVAVGAACSSDSATPESAPLTSTETTSTTEAEATTTTSVATEDVSLADGRLLVPGVNVGDIDLTALPVGDEHVGQGQAVGSLDLCPTFPTDGGGAQVEGPWFNDDGTWDLTAKYAVLGEVNWPEAEFATSVSGDERSLVGNNLPVDAPTGSFPVAADDPIREFDQNPSAIAENAYDLAVPANPTESGAPSCVSGEVGFLLNGVVLNSPVDAMGRDAVAWEGQDPCQGHPNQAGYHYHSVSPCVPDEGTGHSELVGYALDGFGIYGHRGEEGVAVTNDDLDECHGHTHEIEWDGATVEMFHYHATWEFPYAVGCFKGTSAFQGPVLAPPGGGPPP